LSRRTLATLVAAAAVSALAPAGASAATRNVLAGADGVARNVPAGYTPNAFFRRSVTIHVGDSVRWQFRGFHTVTIPSKGQGVPPLIAPNPGQPVSGFTDAAGRPFWFNGQASLPFNLLAAAPQGGTTYDGQSLVGSGVPQGASPKPFTVRFTQPGVFQYYCAIHNGMRGTVVVRRAAKPIPTARQNAREAAFEINANARHARLVATKPVAAGTVSVGRSPRGERWTINKFFPSTRTVRLGGSLTFTMAGQTTQEIHTVTFRPANVPDVDFIAGPGANPLAAYPSDPPPTLPPYDGTNHGNGFLNSGLLDNDSGSPTPNTVRVTFTRTGTFRFECLIHDGMEGTVTVTP
jgi:plastocyanin